MYFCACDLMHSTTNKKKIKGLELLTKTGWTSAYTMEAVIIQLMASFIKGQATIKASKDVSKCFTKKSAISSFR